MGSGNSGLTISWDTPGTVGNGKTCAILVAGANTALSVTVTTTDVTITSATNGSSAATSTVLDILNALYANQTFRDNWRARPVGDGTGVIAAAASSALANGVNGETFTVLSEVKGVQGPNFQSPVIDVTSFDSARVREFISGLVDPGQLTFNCNYVPNAWNAGQQRLFPLIQSGARRTYELQLADLYKITISMQGILTGAGITAELENALNVALTAKITGMPTWY
ncbi:MAG: hypothetical protein K2X87_09235 [Gemmataceae bacterium]|nr:hypothetical protein [Gemmataceae bacterium]